MMRTIGCVAFLAFAVIALCGCKKSAPPPVDLPPPTPSSPLNSEKLKRFRLTKHMVGGVGAGLAGFDGWLFPGEPRRWR